MQAGAPRARIYTSWLSGNNELPQPSWGPTDPSTGRKSPMVLGLLPYPWVKPTSPTGGCRRAKPSPAQPLQIQP